jgi:GNAT superfamily N-acetyltransferase
MLLFEKPTERFIELAVELVKSAYKEEREFIEFLPESDVYTDMLKGAVEYLFSAGNGIIATEDNELVGFMVGFEPEQLFGKNKGIYVPLFGHGCKKERREQLYREMYKYAADKWVGEERTSHAITIFAHHRETVDLWFWQGFGLRCVDAVRKVEAIGVNSSDARIVKAEVKNIPDLIYIHKEHNAYYRKAPIFMPNEEVDIVQELTELLETENSHMWIAYKDNSVVGYMVLQDSAESFISEYEKLMNVKNTYVCESERNSGVGVMLLQAVQSWLKEEGYTLCGVDYESINALGSSFWNKHFTPYTYSLTRRIDERILSIK